MEIYSIANIYKYLKEILNKFFTKPKKKKKN